MSVSSTLRSFLRMRLLQRGYTIVPFPIKKYLDDFGIDLVLDVGANVGQYGTDLRGLGYRGRIISFEPMSTAFAELESASRNDNLWETCNYALGDVATTQDLHISANGPSSSFLQLSQDALKADIDLKYVGREEVAVKRLADVLPEIRNGAMKMFLKIDTQGFEKNVIDGAGKALEQFTGIQVELSLTRQYDGELLASEFMEVMIDRGFNPYWFLHGYRSRSNMQLKQVDMIYFRNSD